MINKKICMLGAFSVGKTSLVAQYVHSVFSDKYLSTVGVKISKKTIAVDDGQEVTLVLWDMEGRDIFTNVNVSYLRGAMGFFVVADGTRAETLDTALELRSLVLDQVGAVPNALLVNKADLADQWEITESRLNQASAEGIAVFRTSAKTGQSVEEAFRALAEAMLKAGRNV
ncbi:MAG: GTP-binding protein [Desulfobulbus sp.]|uniref:Rab family GTPase n=1 Tax=Desulfobulbus sp. TaxID=895 RepID=UPI002847DF9B|nr:GTP-binding protein [Desulfobulbus sp.]MDR2549097.1 GTP-binding protein [Desulfobulbus sp.]